MKQMLWISLIPLTAFWLFAVDIYGPPLGLVPSLISILLGLIISIIGFWRTDAIFDKKFAIILAPLALSSFVIPYPYNAGLILIILALFISLVIPKFKSIWLGALFVGVLLIVDAVTLMMYYLFAQNYHQVNWLSPTLAFLSGMTGLDTASNGGMLLISAQGNIFPFSITLEKLGFYPWILIFAGSVILIFLEHDGIKAQLKRFLGILLVSFVYLSLRFIILIHIFFFNDLPEYARNRTDIFIGAWWLILSFVPLILLLLWIYPIGNLKFNFRLDINRRLIITFTAVFISVFCLTSAVIFQELGVRKDGRILVDEIHSLWEFSTLKLDKDWYGENSTYNAYSMVEWLNDTYKVQRIVSPSYKDLNVPGAKKIVPNIVSKNLTYDILKNYDILIIKTPSHYEPDEVNAIVRFVENGGGLFLIGDHTNFAGTGTNLNQISERFGIKFGFDSVNTISGKLYYYKRAQLPHPIVKYMPSLDFMTGCSLIAPIGGESAILGFGLGANPGEYASVGFFRETRTNDPTQATDTTWGLINQAVAVKCGKGRVVAFSDSTIISNFRIFFGGSPNLIIGVMEYLNRNNSYENVKQILFLVGLIAAGLAAFILGRTAWGDRKMAALIISLIIGTLSASGALLASSTKVEGSIPSQFYVRNHTVSFDGEHSGLVVSQGGKNGQYETFFVWTQRLNLTPTIEDSLKEAIAKGRLVVIIDPIKPLSQDDMARIIDYIKDGNSMLLMMDSNRSWSFLAKYFGLETYQISKPSNKNWAAYKGLPIKPWGMAIKGGNSLLNVNGRVVLAEADYGKGKFVLFTDSQVFKDGLYGKPGYMGSSQSTPSIVDKKKYDLRALYNLEYNIFEYALGMKNSMRLA